MTELSSLINKYLFINENTHEDAKKLKLTSAGWGKWKNAQGEVTHKTVNGKLVKIDDPEKLPILKAINMGLHRVPGSNDKWMNSVGIITHKIKNGKLIKVEKKESEGNPLSIKKVKFKRAIYSDINKEWYSSEKWETGIWKKYSNIDNRFFDKNGNRVSKVYTWEEI